MPDVYAIGVRIALSSNASQVLGVLGKDLLGIDVRAKGAEASLGRVKAAAIGLGSVLGGSAIVGGLAKLVEHAKEFVHQQSVMAQAGVSQADIANAAAAAWKTAGDVIGSSATKNLALIGDLRDSLGSMPEAIAAAPSMARLGVVLQNLTGQDQEAAGYSAARFLEQRGSLVNPKTGQIDASLMEHNANQLAAITAGTRGRVGPDQLLGFQTTARLAGAQLSDQGLINMAPVIAAAKSASTVGTQLSSLENQLIGGVMTNASAHWLEHLGVVNPKRVHEMRGGRMQFDAGALIDEETLRRDPREWIKKYIGGGLLREGFSTPDTQAGAVLQSHLRTTVTGLIGEILRSYASFSKGSRLIDIAAGANQYDVAQKTDPTTKMAAFTTAWSNLLTALGAPIVNDATGLIGRLTTALTGLTKWASTHQNTVGVIEDVAAGLGALGVVGGSLAITKAALGPFVTGLRGLVGVLSGTEIAAAVAVLEPVGAGLLTVAGGITAIAAALVGFPALVKSIEGALGYGKYDERPYKDRFKPPPSSAPEPLFQPRAVPGDTDLSHRFRPTAYETGVSGQQPRLTTTAYEPGSDGITFHVSMPVYLDGNVIATHTERKILRRMTPNALPGTTTWDPRALPTPPGLVTA